MTFLLSSYLNVNSPPTITISNLLFIQSQSCIGTPPEGFLSLKIDPRPYISILRQLNIHQLAFSALRNTDLFVLTKLLSFPRVNKLSFNDELSLK